MTRTTDDHAALTAASLTGAGHPHRIIRAAAGSGKTYQLTTRYLRLVAAGAGPESILATTFTRKAAGEILARVLGRLAHAAADDKARAQLAADLKIPLTQADCRALLARLARSLHRLAISTIDSFFNRIASSFRFELDVPLEPQLVDEAHPLARQLRFEAIEAMLADQDLHLLLDLLRRLHHDTAARSVTAAIDGIVSDLYDVYREAPDRAAWTRIATPPGLLDAVGLRSALAALHAMETQLPLTKAGSPNVNWGKAWSASLAAAQRSDWDALLATGIAAKLVQGEEKFSSVVIPSAWADVYKPLIHHARAALIDRLARHAEATYDLLHRFDVHYTRLRREHRVLLFSDLTHKLSRHLPTLGDDVLMEVYYRLDAQVAHLLLDEFQDTSLEQWRVLEPFAAEVLAHSDGGRSFFCVGDTKQAIYGWRGGCAELFDEVEHNFIAHPDARQSLTQSYRSSKVVLDAVNRVFENLDECEALAVDFAAAEQWRLAYEKHKAAKDLPGYVRLITSPAAVDIAEENLDPDDEAADEDVLPPVTSSHEAFAAEQVRDLHRRSPQRTLGVLVSTNRSAQRMIDALRRLEVPVSGEGGNPVTDVPAVAAVLAAMTLADHPGHSAAAFHVANSPLGPVVGLRSTRPDEVEAAALRMRRALLDEGYASVIARWVPELAPSCDARSLDRLLQLVELAERYEPIVTLRPARFVAFVEATPVEEPTPAPVRVMTIHAAKGLEFDAVVLPELDRRLTNNWPVLVERATPTGPIVGVYRSAAESIRRQVPTLEAAHAAQRARQRREDLCKLYVAMTRARHALHMIVRPLEPKADGSPKSIGLCFAAILRQTLAPGIEETYAGGQILAEWGGEGEAEAIEPPATKPSREGAMVLPSVARWLDGSVATSPASPDVRRSWLSTSPSSLESAGRVRAADLLDFKAHAAQQRGTLVHAWLEAVGFIDDPDAVPDDDALLAIAQRVMSGELSEAWVREQLAALRATLAQPSVRQALERSGATDLWREQPFAVREQGRLLRGTFDRVAIRREAGRPVAARLIDFKTDRVTPATLPAAVERYRPQITAYRRALARLLNLQPSAIHADLLFLATGDVVAVEKDKSPVHSPI